MQSRFMAFIGLYIYLIIQVFVSAYTYLFLLIRILILFLKKISYKNSHILYSTKLIFIFRVVLCSIIALNIILSMLKNISIHYQTVITYQKTLKKAITFGNLAYKSFKGDKLKWKPEDGVYFSRNILLLIYET